MQQDIQSSINDIFQNKSFEYDTGNNTQDTGNLNKDEVISISKHLIQHKFLLTALEYYQELSEAGVNVGPLEELFTNEDEFDKILKENHATGTKIGTHPDKEWSSDVALLHMDVSTSLEKSEQEIALLQYRLRGKDIDISDLKMQVAHLHKQFEASHANLHDGDSRRHKRRHSSSSTISFSTEDLSNQQTEGNESLLRDPITGAECDTLYALIKRFLLDQNLSMTAVTLEQETGGINDTQADEPLQITSLSSSSEAKFSLLQLYRHELRPSEAVRKAAKDSVALRRNLEQTETDLRNMKVELEHAQRDLQASEQRVAALTNQVNQLRQEKQQMAQSYERADPTDDEEVQHTRQGPSLSKLYERPSKERYDDLIEKAVQVSKQLAADNESLTNSGYFFELVNAVLPLLSHIILSKHRKLLFPLYSACICGNTSPETRRSLFQNMLTLVKHPDHDTRKVFLQWLLKIVHSYAQGNHADEDTNGGPRTVDAVEQELLPHVLTLATNRHKELRALAAESCGVLADYISTRRVDSVLATLNLLADDDEPSVCASVVSSACNVVVALQSAYKHSAWSSNNEEFHRPYGVTSLKGAVRRQFAQLEDLLWRFLLMGPSDSQIQGLTFADGTDPSQTYLKNVMLLRKMSTISTENVSKMDVWSIAAFRLLPSILSWAHALRVLWSDVMPQFLDFLTDIENCQSRSDTNSMSETDRGTKSTMRRMSTASIGSAHSTYTNMSDFRGGRSINLSDASKTYFIVAAFIFCLPKIRELATQESPLVRFHSGEEHYDLSSGDDDSSHNLKLVSMNLSQTNETQTNSLLDALWSASLFVVADRSEYSEGITPNSLSLEDIIFPGDVQILWPGAQWIMRQLIPELLRAIVATPTSTAAGKHVRIAYGSVVRALCDNLGSSFTIHFVLPIFTALLGLPLPDQWNSVASRSMIGIVAEQSNLTERLAPYNAGAASMLVYFGEEAGDVLDTSDVDATMISSVQQVYDQILHSTKMTTQNNSTDLFVQWIQLIPHMSKLLDLSENSSSLADNARLLLPVLGSGVLSLPSVPRPIVSHILRELLQHIAHKRDGWSSALHSPVVEQCVILAGVFARVGETDGEEENTVMKHLLTTLRRISANPTAQVRNSVACMLKEIFRSLPTSILLSDGLPIAQALLEDSDAPVARSAVASIAGLYTSSTHMNNPMILSEVNKSVSLALQRGPKVVIIECLRSMMRAIPNAPSKLRDGFMLDRLLELSNKLLEASEAGKKASDQIFEATSQEKDEDVVHAANEAAEQARSAAVQAIGIWDNARVVDLEEVAMAVLEAFRAFVSVAPLLGQETRGMVADDVDALLQDPCLLDESYKTMMQSSLQASIARMRSAGATSSSMKTTSNITDDNDEENIGIEHEGLHINTQKNDSTENVSQSMSAPHHEHESEESRAAAEAGLQFLRASSTPTANTPENTSSIGSAATPSHSSKFGGIKSKLNIKTFRPNRFRKSTHDT